MEKHENCGGEIDGLSKCAVCHTFGYSKKLLPDGTTRLYSKDHVDRLKSATWDTILKRWNTPNPISPKFAPIIDSGDIYHDLEQQGWDIPDGELPKMLRGWDQEGRIKVTGFAGASDERAQHGNVRIVQVYE